MRREMFAGLPLSRHEALLDDLQHTKRHLLTLDSRANPESLP
jgi:hypothetical protein